MMKRNQWNRLLTVVLSVMMAVALVAGEAPGTVDIAKAKKTTKTGKSKKKIALNKKAVTLKVGKTVRLKLKGASGRVVWKSRNKSIATVTKKGVVRAKKKGKTVIIAKWRKKTYRCFVKVASKNSAAKDVDWEEAADKFTELAEFIKANGVDQEGTMVVQKTASEEGEETTLSVSYNEAENVMIFEKISKASENDQTIAGMTIYGDDLENAAVDVELIDSGIFYIGGTDIEVAEYTGEDELELELAAENGESTENVVSAEEAESTSEDSEGTASEEEEDEEAQMNTFASDFFNEALYEWNDYLAEIGVEVSLADIGFASMEF